MSDPVPLHPDLPDLTDKKDWRTRFLLRMRDAPTVRAACEAAGISHVTAYALRKSDPSFAEQWEAALQFAWDKLEQNLYDRANATDTTAAIFILKARRPHLYRETVRTEITGVDGGPVLLAALANDRARLAASLAEDDAGATPEYPDRAAIAGDSGGAEPPASDA